VTNLQALYTEQGQSPWVDNVQREWLRNGHLAEIVETGVRGVTSNPTIFAKAIQGEDDYDEQFGSLVSSMSVEAAYWELVIDDIVHALGVLRGVHEESHGTDGFVSLEVAPALAHDTESTVRSALSLHERIDTANLLVKVPATAEGVPAIHRLIAAGKSINVTLIFGLSRYDEVMEAYVSGLEAYAASGHDDLSSVASVASFFVSRVDTEIDHRLETLAARRGRGRAGTRGLPALPRDLLRPPLGGPGGQGCPGPAPAVGLDLDQEPRVLRPPLRGHPDRPRHRQHDARGDPPGLR